MSRKNLNYLKTKKERKRIVSSIAEEKEADIKIKNGKIVNTYTREIVDGDITIYGDRIGTVGIKNNVKAKIIIDAKRKYVTPGLMDGHLHIDACLLNVSNFVKGVIPHGTSAVFLDSHEIANALGVDGVKMMIEEGKNTPLRVFQYVPAQVPPGSEKVQTPNEHITLEHTKELYTNEAVIGLGEVSKFRVLKGDPYFVEKIEWILREGGVVDGSAHDFTGKKLQAYVASGIFADHESIAEKYALERARLGLTVMLREGTTEHNVRDCIKILKKRIDSTNFCFCSDDWFPTEIVEKGHINNSIKIAIEEGIDPVVAIQMATINCARNFGLDTELGGLAPGKLADMLIVDDLKNFEPEIVIIGGKIVAKNGELTSSWKEPEYPAKFLNSIKIHIKITPNDLKINVEGNHTKAKIKIIEAKEGKIWSGKKSAVVPIVGGEITSQPLEDIIKIVVVERYGKTSGPNIGKGFVRGFGLRSGAIAQSLAQDKHDIVGIGANDKDMTRAINEVVKIQGGIVLIRNKELIDFLELPIGGILSTKSAAEVNEKLLRLSEKAKNLMECTMNNPFGCLQFQTHPMIPYLKITDKGIVDVQKEEIVGLIEELLD